MALDKIKVNDTTTVNTGVVYDITKATSQAYDSLSAALGTDGNNVPSEVREGGMTIRFVLTSDNKYVQYRLIATSFSTTESDWQGVDDEPVANSKNLVESGGVFNEILEKTSTFEYSAATDRKDVVRFVNENNEVIHEISEEKADFHNLKSDGEDVVIGLDFEKGETSEESVEYQRNDGSTILKIDEDGVFVDKLKDLQGNEFLTSGNGAQLVLPKKIPYVLGQEQYLYFENITKGRLYKTNYGFTWWAWHKFGECLVLKTNDAGEVYLQHGEHSSSNKISGNIFENISLLDNLGNIIDTKEITINTIAKNSATANLKIVVIGDSKTDNASKLAEVLNLCQKDTYLSVEFLGENHDTAKDSDGNTRTVNNEGFSGARIDLFGKSSLVGAAFYDNNTNNISIAKGFGIIGVPDIVWIDMGANQNYTNWSTVLGAYEEIISQVKAYNTANNTNIRIVISVQEGFCLTPTLYSNPTKANLDGESNVSKYLAAFENRENEGIFVCPQYINIDLYNDFPIAEVPCNSRTAVTEKVCLDNIHPGVNVNYYDSTKIYNRGNIFQTNDAMYLCLKDNIIEITPSDDKINYAVSINRNEGYFKLADMYYATLKYIATLI